MLLDYKLDIGKNSIWHIANRYTYPDKPPFLVTEAGKFYAAPGYFNQSRDRDTYILIYTLDGQGELEYAGKTWQLQKNAAVFIEPDSTYRCRTNCAGQWVFYWLHITGESLPFYRDALYSDGFTVQYLEDHHCAGFDAILDNIRIPQRDAYSAISQCVDTVLHTMVRGHMGSDHAAQHRLSIKAAVEYICENFNQQLDVDKLSEVAGMSKYYFIKQFRQQMHTTPYEYLLLHRVNEAKKLLVSTGLKAAQISVMVGFADESNFSRTFKRFAGMTPMQYRKTT